MFHYITIILCCFALGCTGLRNHNPNHIVQGKIVLIGNEPFTQLAIQDEDGYVFQLICPKRLEQKLLQNQGDHIRVYYSQIVQTEQYARITVERYELVELKK